MLADVGARWGAVDFWTALGDKARVVCFEADADEALRLAAENSSPHVEYAPFALGADGSPRTLHLTEGPGCSSVYPPLAALYERYPGCGVMRPSGALACETTTLDAFFDARGIGRLHALKLDTQGSELDILRGAERRLAECLFVNVEVEFNALYKGQPLFCDVDRHLRERGFVLWRLNNLAHYSTGLVASEPHPILLASEPGSHQYVPVDNGQLFWADAFYVRAAACPTSDAALSREDAVAGAILVGQWRLWDLALEMIRKSGDAALYAELRRRLPEGTPTPTFADRAAALERTAQEARAEVEALRRENEALRAKLTARAWPWARRRMQA